jgi:hypothetical protein
VIRLSPIGIRPTCLFFAIISEESTHLETSINLWAIHKTAASLT